MRKEFLRIARGRKIEQGEEILKDFWLTSYEGEVVEIVGNHIRELDCIVRILAGEENFSYADLFYEGNRLLSGKVKSPLEKIITLVSDRTEFVDQLSISENFICMSSKVGPLFVRSKENRTVLMSYLKEFHLSINPDLPVGALNRLQLFQLQLLKLYHQKKRGVLLNVNEYSLTEAEIEELFILINQLKEKGMTFFIVCYNPLPAQLELDHILIIKHACTVAEYEKQDCKDITQIESILGPRKLQEEFNATNPDAPVVFRLCNVKGENLWIDDFFLHKGEVSIINASSTEQKVELFHLLTGETFPLKGEILINGSSITGFSREKRIKAGLLCAENRFYEGFIFEKMTVLDNYIFQKGMRNKKLWWSFRHRKVLQQDLERTFGRGCASKKAYELSVYEQHKLKYMSYLLQRPNVLVCMDPFSSVDMETGHMAEIMLGRLAEMGTAILILCGNSGSFKESSVKEYRIDHDGFLTETETEEEENIDFWF